MELAIKIFKRIIHGLGQIIISFYDVIIAILTFSLYLFLIVPRFLIFIFLKYIKKAYYCVIKKECIDNVFFNFSTENTLLRKIKNFVILGLLITISYFFIFYPDTIQKYTYDFCKNIFSLYYPCIIFIVPQSIFVRIICSIGFLVSGWTFILVSYVYFRKHKFILLLSFCIISFLGIVLYAYHDSCRVSHEKSKDRLILESGNDVNNALSSFFPSRGDTNFEIIENNYSENTTQDDRSDIPENWKMLKSKVLVGYYVLFHCIAYLFCGIMTSSLWGRRFVNHLHNSTTFDKLKYVFWGQELDERCLLLGQDIYQNCYQAEVIISLFDNRVANYIDENRLYDNFYEKHFILRIYNENYFPFDNLFAPYHFFISDDELWNVKGSIQLLEERKKYGIKNKFDLYIRLGEGDKCAIFENLLNDLSKKYSDVNLHVFNESELIARRFVQKHPTLLAPSIKDKIINQTAKLQKDAQLHILLLGFGWQGRQLLSQIVGSSQFLTDGQKEFKSPLSVDIIEKQSKNFSQYRKLREIACNKYNLFFYECDIFAESFISWLTYGQKFKKYDRIIISLGDDALNLEAFALMQKLKKIFVSKNNLEIYVKQNHLLFDQVNQYNKDIKKSVFGIMSDIYTKDMILDENIDVMAKYLHAIYDFKSKNEENFKIKKDFYKNINYILENGDKYFDKNEIIQKKVNKTWQSLSLYNKKSTRTQAEGLINLLYLLGFEINNSGTQDTLNDLKNIIESEDIIKYKMAEIEHMRWEAYMLMQGIMPWNINEKTTREEAMIDNKIKTNQVDKKFRHGALVEFKWLPYVDKILEYLESFTEAQDSCKNKGIDVPDNPPDLDMKPPTKSQEYNYDVNLLPIILKIAGIKIKKMN